MLRRRQNCPSCGRCLLATVTATPLGLTVHFRRHRQRPHSPEACATVDQFRQFSHV